MSVSVGPASLLLHVGRSKTGTTALQEWLGDSRDEIARAGLHFPDFFLGSSQADLAIAHSARPGRLARALAVETPSEQVELQSRINTALERNVRPGQTWMFTSEHLGSRLRSREEVGSLLGSLQRHFGTIWIVAFVRRPDYLAPSLYSEAVKAFEVRPLDASFIRRRHGQFDQAAFARRWADQGAELVLRPYVERYRLEPEAYFHDWLALIHRLTGVDLAASCPEPPRRQANTSLSAQAVEYLRWVNLSSSESPISGAARRRLIRALGSVPGSPLRVAPEASKAIHRKGWTTGSLDMADLAEDPLWREWFEYDSAPVGPQAVLDEHARQRIADLCHAQGASPNGRAWFDRLPRKSAMRLRRAAIRSRRS